MGVVKIIKRGNKYYARRVDEGVESGVSQAITVENPALKWNVLDSSTIAGKSSLNFFVAPVDPDEIYGNYSRPYLEVPARITGLKFDILPAQFDDTLHGGDFYRLYIDNINRAMRGTMTLIVNRYPIFDWKVDDIGPMIDSIEIREFDDVAVISLQAREFTVFRDLLASRMVRTRGQDQIYVNMQLKEAFAGGGLLPQNFAIKTTLQIRPEQRFIAGTEVIAPPMLGFPRPQRIQPRVKPPRVTPQPPSRQVRPPVRIAPRGGGISQMIGEDWTPYAFYSILNRDRILANGGRVVEFFVDTPDPLHLDGNYDEPYIHRDMSIQGLKVGWYPWIAIGTGNANSQYGYLIGVFKDATFELIVNRAPIYTFKGADLFGATIIKPYRTGTNQNQYLYARQREKYLVFRDLIDQRKLTVSYLDDVKIRARLPVTLTSQEFVGCEDFEIKLTLLVNAKPKPIRV